MISTIFKLMTPFLRPLFHISYPMTSVISYIIFFLTKRRKSVIIIYLIVIEYSLAFCCTLDIGNWLILSFLIRQCSMISFHILIWTASEHDSIIWVLSLFYDVWVCSSMIFSKHQKCPLSCIFPVAAVHVKPRIIFYKSWP